MKTRKHGKGLTHKQVIQFSNRLQAGAKHQPLDAHESYTYSTGFENGWESACKYYAHELRKELRYIETQRTIKR